MHIRYFFISLGFLTAFSVSGCDSEVVSEEMNLKAESEVVLNNGTFGLSIRSNGAIDSGVYLPGAADTDSTFQFFNTLGIWTAGLQEGPRANIAGTNPVLIENLGFAKSIEEGGGLYVLTSDDDVSKIKNWPGASGAPTDSNGQPKLYGDMMAWGLYETVNRTGRNNASFDGLRVGMTVFLNTTGPLANVMFVKYDVTNTSSTNISDLNLGFGGDVDLQWVDISQRCGTISHSYNKTGYDLSRHMSYTYITPLDLNEQYPEDCFGALTGFSILDLTSNHGLAKPKQAHRMLTNYSNEPYPEFSRAIIETPQQMSMALKGLSISGEPMINPITHEATKFAYTGDPVSGTGWLDTPHDVRSLQSIEPVELLAGETVSIEVAIYVTKSPNLEQGLAKLKSMHDTVLQLRHEWDY